MADEEVITAADVATVGSVLGEPEVDHSQDQEITPDTRIVEVEPEPENPFPPYHPGVEDGTVVNGERVVHEKDAHGELAGWHKEAVEG